jgi:Na+:H+ antiporter, NhaA family
VRYQPGPTGSSATRQGDQRGEEQDDATGGPLWSTRVGITVGDFAIVEDPRHWVDDGLMAIFFFVVGLEIKYELVSGELREQVPASARLFVLTLAIVDDLCTITVIAVFYTSVLSVGWLAVTVGLLTAVVALRWIRIWSIPVYLLLGVAVWVATYRSGVHATIAGVAMGLLTSAKPLLDQRTARELVRERVPDQLEATELRRYRFLRGWWSASSSGWPGPPGSWCGGGSGGCPRAPGR